MGAPEEICLKYNKGRNTESFFQTEREERLLEQSGESAAIIGQWLEKDMIEAIHSCEPTLERVFLEVTGRRLS